MKKLSIALALALPACSPAVNLNAAVSAEQSATCPTDNEGKARIYGARALFDRTARDGLSPEQRAELDAARAEVDARCRLG